MRIAASKASGSLEDLIEQVNQDRTTVEIASEHGDAVLVSKEEYRSLVETAYLLQSPANAERLLNSMRDARAGAVTYNELL